MAIMRDKQARKQIPYTR